MQTYQSNNTKFETSRHFYCHHYHQQRFEFLIAMTTKITVFWDEISYRLVDIYQNMHTAISRNVIKHWPRI